MRGAHLYKYICIKKNLRKVLLSMYKNDILLKFEVKFIFDLIP